MTLFPDFTNHLLWQDWPCLPYPSMQSQSRIIPGSTPVFTVKWTHGNIFSSSCAEPRIGVFVVGNGILMVQDWGRGVHKQECEEGVEGTLIPFAVMLGHPETFRACNPRPLRLWLSWLAITCLDLRWARPEKPASMVLRCREYTLSSPFSTCE